MDELRSLLDGVAARRVRESGNIVSEVGIIRTTTSDGEPPTKIVHADPLVMFDGGDAAHSPSGGEADEEDKLVAVSHPNVGDVEDILGPPTEEDKWCYLCDGVHLHEAASLSDDTKRLRDNIAEGRKLYNDNLLLLARKIKEDYDRIVYEPGVAAATAAASSSRDIPVREWTLRSVYQHIRRHDTSTTGVIDNTVHDIKELTDTLKDRAVYVAPRECVRGGRLTDRNSIQVSRVGYAMYRGSLQMLGTFLKLRADICADAKNGSGKGGGGGSSKGGGSVVATISAVAQDQSTTASSTARYKPTPLPDY